MFNRYFKTSLGFVILIIGYYILSIYLDDMVIIAGVLLIAVPIAIYNIVVKRDFEYKLEMFCDADSYLEIVEKKYSNKDESFYNTYLAYAYLYQGNFDNATLAIQKVDKEVIKQKPKDNIVYYMVLLKLAFHEENIEKFNLLFEEFHNIDLGKKINIDFKVFEVPRYILEGRYQEVVDMLMGLIPRQTKRYLIIELEYYLAIAYIELDKIEDATAVLEFISKKRYRLFYIEKCQEMLDKIQIEN